MKGEGINTESLKNNYKLGKYNGTIAGIFFAIPFLISLLNEELVVIRIFAIISIFPLALPLESIGKLIFDNFIWTSLLVLFGLSLCFYISTKTFFKKTIKDRNENNPANVLRIWMFILLQTIIIHPFALYFLVFITATDSTENYYFFYMIYTFPFSSCILVIIGIMIDVIKNKNVNLI